MGKFIKKIFCFALMAVSVFSLAFGGISVVSPKADESEILNVYLIAGQSNAVGLSPTGTITDKTKLEEYKTGYSNVLYRGKGDSVNVTDYTTTVKTGLGSTANHVGTEVGIAEVISKNDPDKKSLIIKRAVGGTYLVDEKKVTESNGGNWCPPSMRSKTPLSQLTGILYDEFVALVKNSVAHYQESGYTVHLKGTFWMQGEAETDTKANADKYESHLTALINDLRADFEPIFDNYAPSAPFVIGKIAPTFNGGNGFVTDVRAAQDKVAASMSRVFKVETDDYVIVDPETQLPAAGCPDRYHFCGDDVVALGRDVANCFLANDVPAVEVITGKNGTSDVKYQEFNGQDITVTFTPNEYFSIGKLTANGVDVTAQMTGNSYVVENSTEYVTLKMEFTEADKYTMKLDYNRDQASVQKSKYAYYYYEGQTLTLKVLPKTGYEVNEVKFDGTVLTANADGEYEITITSGENKFSVTFNAVQAPNQNTGNSSENNTTSETKKGCKSTVGLCGGLVALAIATGVGLTRKRRMN